MTDPMSVLDERYAAIVKDEALEAILSRIKATSFGPCARESTRSAAF
jgi:hypothetical protein